MDSVDEIIAAFGGATEMARVVGKTPQAISNMRARDSIPPEHWPALIDEAARKKIKGVTAETLMQLAVKRAAKRPTLPKEMA